MVDSPDIISLDTETHWSRKLKYTVRTMLPEAYAAHPLFDCFLVSVCNGRTAWAGHPTELNWEALEGTTLLSHNARFDQAIIRELIKRGIIPKFTPRAWHCTANMGAYLWNRRALADAVEHAFKVKLDKGARDNSEGKHWPNDYTEAERKTFLEYARSDVVWCRRLFIEHGDRWPEHERRLSELTIRRGVEGIAINRELLNDYLIRAHDMRLATEKQLPWLADTDDDDDDWGVENPRPTSTKAIAEMCRRSGIPACPVKSDDEDAYQDWEDTYAPTHLWIGAVPAWRSINKLQKTLQTIKDRLRDDGTMPYSLKYFGAHCLTGDAEVLTPSGWVGLADWQGGLIAQWREDKSIEFLPASPNQFNCDEHVIEIDAPYFKGIFTRGHTMPVLTHGSFKHQTVPAERFSECASRWVPVSGRLTSEGAITADQMRVLIATQADGHWILNDGFPHLQFCLRKARKIERIQELLQTLNVAYRCQEFPSTPGQIRISVSAIDCPGWLTPDRKIFGPWLLDSTAEAREIFTEEILFWDGYRKTAEYYSSIKENLDWAATMSHLTGRAMRVREKPQRGNRKPAFAGSQRPTNKALVFSREHVQWLGQSNRIVFCPSTQTGFFLFRYKGAIAVTGNTGRMSGDGKLNMQNFPREPYLTNQHGLLEKDDRRIAEALKLRKKTGAFPDWVTGSIDIRNLLIARPGKKFVISDLSQIEARIVNWLAGNHAMLDLVRSGTSVYEAFARGSLGWTGGNLKTEDENQYAMAKAMVLGLGFGCAWEKFITVAMKMAGVDVAKDDPEFVEQIHPITGERKMVDGWGTNSKRIVKTFRDANPKIVALWRALDENFRRSIASDFTMTLPSGRVMRYEHVRGETRIEQDKETGLPRRKSVYTAEIGGRRTICYGGLLTENITQACARDVLMHAVLALEDAGLPVILTIHDEVIIECDLDTPTDLAHSIMTTSPLWMSDLPVGAETKETSCYLK